MSGIRALAIPILLWALVLILLIGCASDRASVIPQSASLGSSGDGRISYTAGSDGTIWVYDVPNDRIDYSGPISLSQSIFVDPPNHQITLDGRVVTDKSVDRGEHRIFFQPSAVSSARGY